MQCGHVISVCLRFRFNGVFVFLLVRYMRPAGQVVPAQQPSGASAASISVSIAEVHDIGCVRESSGINEFCFVML